jgi:hypothetical protein
MRSPLEPCCELANLAPDDVVLEGRLPHLVAFFIRLCLSEIKSGHIRDAVRRGRGGKE